MGAGNRYGGAKVARVPSLSMLGLVALDFPKGREISALPRGRTLLHRRGVTQPPDGQGRYQVIKRINGLPLISQTPTSARAKLLACVAVLGLAGCAASPNATPEDPYEEANRKVHAFNLGLDRAVLKPVSDGPIGAVLRSPVGTGISNFANNLSAPSDILNSLLQARAENTLHNSWRFLVNTTVGLGGIFDPATPLGLERRETDFGATLGRWGVPEGAFLMLPVLGPSNQRDATGWVVDRVIDPVGHLLDAPESYWATGISLTSKVGYRARFSQTVESILYGSADSYSQLRLMQNQSRRFELGQEADDAFIDPYADLDGN